MVQSVATETSNGSSNGSHSDRLLQGDVSCHPRTGIEILIVGAGVGGLTAALECYRKGHTVRIIEREQSAASAGDQFTIGLSARRIFKHYPSMLKEFDENAIDNRIQFLKWTGEPIGPAFSMGAFGDRASMAEMGGPPMVMQLRPLFHAMLYHQLNRFGIPVLFGQKVVSYYEDAARGIGGVKTEGGKDFEADVVIAADGLHSRSNTLVANGEEKAQPSGQSLYRCAMPLSAALKDPVVREQFGLDDGGKPFLRAMIGPNTHAMVMSYVNKRGGNGMLAWAVNYKEPREQSTVESWHKTISNEQIIKVLDETNEGWSSAFKSLVKSTPHDSGAIHWPVLFRNPRSIWFSSTGRVLQLGDAAHSFIPTSGNGATQAMEDAISIAECLQQAGKKDVPLAVQTHNILRSERVSCAQLLGFVNAERYHHAKFSELTNDPSKVMPKAPKWIVMHDTEQYTADSYENAAASLRDGGEAFTASNVPPGHMAKKWTIEDIHRLHAEGKSIELTGDWS